MYRKHLTKDQVKEQHESIFNRLSGRSGLAAVIRSPYRYYLSNPETTDCKAVFAGLNPQKEVVGLYDFAVHPDHLLEDMLAVN